MTIKQIAATVLSSDFLQGALAGLFIVVLPIVVAAVVLAG